jgi:hypothetical protein
MYFRTTRNNVIYLAVCALFILFILLTGCAGTRGAGALGGGQHAAMWNYDVNSKIIWKALLEVLRKDPTLFQVGEITKPDENGECIVRGKKGMYTITIWVNPQGQDSTSIEVQAAVGVLTDGPTQANLGQAIINGINKKIGWHKK